MTACYQSPAVNGSYGSYFNTLTQTYYPPNGDCQDYMVPISIDYEAPEFNATQWKTPNEFEDWVTTLTARDGTSGQVAAFGNMKRFKGSYEIAASFCTPKKKNGKEKTVVVATHGIGPARTHWNSPFRPQDFNFVQHAMDKGYSVFFYDRLGCGASTKASGFETQLETAKAVLQVLAKMVKEGKYTGSIKANKVAVMGFSFGSYTTHAAIAATPEIADAVILTGVGFNSSGLNLKGLVRSFIPRIANTENPALYGNRDNGYLTWPDVFGLIHNYFKAPLYSPSTALFTESAKEPFSAGEFLTFASTISAEKWDKPALHITGEKDYIVCDGYCPGIFEEPAKTLYKNAKPLQQTLVKGASHHVNFHDNAKDTFGVITDFLEKNGL
ncbi:Alpha/Beta hydrolase protein [Clohesyomyces aquaticus]|uniref:Alpha/Beta hydrolase protein n=1 Tax=Clohesyomyces aquaticus TaxID=1231657 RepID=A0A1Y1ZXY9_9PLEO|nr:Alpha/Beta hydrolase protein [Clohesyomyces aquaticus]